MENNFKHPIERFRLVKDEFVRSQLIKNFDKSYWAKREEDILDVGEVYDDDGSVHFAIGHSFKWAETHEGDEYWERISEYAISSNYAYPENK